MSAARLERTPFQPGARSIASTLTMVPAECTIRPLHDRIVVEPFDVVQSRYVIVPYGGRPVRGRVLAVGPGIYPKQYDHPEKHRRTKMWDSKVFRKTEVAPGDIVELGGIDLGGYAFDGFYWGDKYCIWASERDVAAVECAG